MSRGGKRFLLYGCGLSIAAVLSFAGFIYKAPADLDMVLGIGQLQLQMGLYSKAKETAAQVLEREPGNPGAIWIQAYSCDRLGEVEPAIAGYRALLNMLDNPEHKASLRISLALLEGRAGRPSKGLEWIRGNIPQDKALQVNQLIAEGYCREGLGNLSQAAGCYLQAVQESQDLPSSLCEGAGRLEAMGLYEEASLAYQAGAERCDPESKYLLSRLKFFAGDTDRAQALLQELSQENTRFLVRRLRADKELVEAIRGSGLFPEGMLGIGVR